MDVLEWVLPLTPGVTTGVDVLEWVLLVLTLVWVGITTDSY